MKRVFWLLVIILLTAMVSGCGVAVYEGESEAGATDTDPELARVEQDLVLLRQRNQDLLLEKQDLVTEKDQLIKQMICLIKEFKQAGLVIHLEELNLIIDELAVEEAQAGSSATKAEFKDDSNTESRNEEDVR